MPYREQQFEALRMEKGVLALSDEEMSSLASQIREVMESPESKE